MRLKVQGWSQGCGLPGNVVIRIVADGGCLARVWNLLGIGASCAMSADKGQAATVGNMGVTR